MFSFAMIAMIAKQNELCKICITIKILVFRNV